MRKQHRLISLVFGTAAALAVTGSAWAMGGGQYGGAAGAGGAAAGGGQPQSAPPAANPPAPQVDTKTLGQFKQAYGKVAEIGKKYRSKIQQANDRGQAQALQQKAQKEMVDAVKGTGLTVKQYNQIAMQVQQDPALRKKVLGGNG